jgi:hypothetical protein
VSGGLGIAGLAAGTTLWLSARSKHQAALNQWNAGDQTTARQTQNAAVQRVHYADVGLVAGGALLGTGILIYTWDALQAHPHSAVGGTPTFSCALGRDSLHLAIEQKF